MTDIETELAKVMQAQAIRKSNVRVFVTYFIVFAYAIGALCLTGYLVWKSEYSLGLGIFNGLSAIAASIAGFWFGNRGNGHPEGIQGITTDRSREQSDAINAGPAGSPAGGASVTVAPAGVRGVSAGPAGKPE